MHCASVCIGHVASVNAIPSADIFLSSRRLDVHNEIVVPDDRLIAGVPGSILSEYCQLFHLVENRKLISGSDFVYVYQYRKFLSPLPGFQTVGNQPYAFSCPSDKETSFFPHHLIADPKIELIGRTIRFSLSTLELYAQHHVCEDLLRFSESIILSKVLSPRQCAHMLSICELIPAPALGLFQKERLLSVLDRLKAAWEYFAPRGFVPRTGYQRRVGGFLLERLHSYLLLDALAKGVEVDRGYQFVATDSDSIIVSN